MTKKEKKRLKTIILRTCIIGFVVLFVVVCIIGWHGSLLIKSWHIFTSSRIEKLEEIYIADFPEDTQFSYYKAVWEFTDIFDTLLIQHTLYIKDVDDPETFCREKLSFKIWYMADIKNSKVIEHNNANDQVAENEMPRYDNMDFVCSGYTEDPKLVFCDVYFFQNSDGSYNAELIWDRWD